MSAKSVQKTPEQVENEVNASQNPVSGPVASNSQRQEELQANNDDVIQALFSNEYYVEPADSTSVVVQGSDQFQNGEIAWTSRWEAPNGFRKEEKLPKKGQVINVPFNFSEAGELEHGDKVKFTAFAEVGGRIDREEREFVIKIPTEELQVWEVFFDSESQDEFGTPTRIDPLIFDLNRDGKLDITGKNQTGDGEISGEAVLFDMDPRRSGMSGWRSSSPGHRPGYYEGKNNSQVPAVPNGRVVYNTGETESTNKHGPGRWTEDPGKGTTADIFDANGELVGHWDKSKWGRSHGGRIGQYYWGVVGNGKKEERTEWIKGTGDGFLVWDHNGNGIIDDNTEMMSEFDAQGNKVFENGFEKLAHYFDANEDGVIEGAELKELKFWVDDGDAKTEKGELRELSEFGIQRITIPKKGELTSTTTATKEEFLD